MLQPATALLPADDPRHWSVVDDNADTIFALSRSTPIEPWNSARVAALLRDKSFGVIVAASANFRERGVSFAGSHFALSAWRGLADAPPHVRRNETMLLDADVSNPDVAADLEGFLGTRIPRIPRLYVVLRPGYLAGGDLAAARARGVRFPNSTSGRHLRGLRQAAVGGWHWMLPGTSSEVKVVADRFFGPLVRRFCCEAELRAAMQLSLASNYAVMAVWDHEDLELAYGAAKFVARSEPRLDIVVTVLGDGDTCAEDPESAVERPEAATYWGRTAGARAQLAALYNPHSFPVTLHVFKAGADVARGMSVRGFTYRAAPLAASHLANDRAERLLAWTRQERRDRFSAETKPAIHVIRQRKHSVSSAGERCPLSARPRFGDTVRAEMLTVSMPGGLVVSRWTDRLITVGEDMSADDVPGYVHALLLDACASQVTTVGVELPNRRRLIHSIRVDGIERGEGTTKRAPSTEGAMWVQTLATAEELLRNDTIALERLDAVQDAAVIARHGLLG